MSVVLTVLHIFVSLVLIAIVLLQAGKGAEIGAAFGAGASQTMFGSRGAATVFHKATAVAAITFMLTSLCLAYYSRKGGRDSVIERGGVAAPEVPGVPPAETGAPSAPPALPGSPAEPVAPAEPAAP
jgi:preprotein translocase subunit SecG